MNMIGNNSINYTMHVKETISQAIKDVIKYNRKIGLCKCCPLLTVSYFTQNALLIII